MKVAVAIPSCNLDRVTDATKQWVSRGYDVFLYLHPDIPKINDARCTWGQYPGWYSACNILTQQAKDYDVVVCAGDDMEPDYRKTATEIAELCYKDHGSLWVMQPVGDDLAGTNQICGSPWLSKEWRERAYGGRFAMPCFYGHYYGDNELLEVSRELGCLYQNGDIRQKHNHWLRRTEYIPKLEYQTACENRFWFSDQQLFIQRRAAGWPGKQLL